MCICDVFCNKHIFFCLIKTFIIDLLLIISFYNVKIVNFINSFKKLTKELSLKWFNELSN